jgi:hypothetical protein
MLSFRRLALLLPLLGLAAATHAQVVPVTYNFNGYTPGDWTNANGWTTTSYNTGALFQVTSGGPDGSNYIRFDDMGAGVGATAQISNTFGSVTTTERFSYSFSYLTSNYWGTAVGVSANAPSSGLLLNASVALGGAQLTLNGNVLGTGSVDFTNTSWFDFRVEVDVGANGGTGSATVFGRTSGSSSWSAITGMTNLNLGLDATRIATDSTNPLLWSTLSFHHEGAASGIDNVSISASAIPEPSTYAALAGAAALGLASYRRRQRRDAVTLPTA